MDQEKSDDDWERDPYDPQQAREWQLLHDLITGILDRYGEKNFIRKGDYWLVDDNWGWTVHQVEIQNLDLLKPAIIRQLQNALIGYPKWSITVRVDVVGEGEEWPGMGIVVYPDRIDDDLKRDYLPPVFRDLVFK
jgi:hypothetical protein